MTLKFGFYLEKTEEVVEEPERRVAGRPGQRLVRANHENPARNRLRNRIQARNVDVQGNLINIFQFLN